MGKTVKLPLRRNDTLPGDQEAAFLGARDRVQDWLQEVGAFKQMVFPPSACVTPVQTVRASASQAWQA